ncbi:MAG: TonB-dependent receptor [Gammaproteobacteria bacterium]
MLNQTVVASFDPEVNWTYEAGYKSSLFGGRVLADVAIFYIDWTDIVIPQTFEEIDGVPLGLPVALSTNAGDATVKGTEVSLQAALTDELTLQVGGSWSDANYEEAKITTFATWPSFYPDGDVSGNALLRQSEWQGNASLTWRHPVTPVWAFYTRGDALYQSEQFVGADNESEIPARTTVNLRLGLDSDTFQVELWTENLFDEDAPTGAFRDVYFNNTPNGTTSAPGDFFAWRMSVSQPRRTTYGVTAS